MDGLRLGVHTGVQSTTIGDLVALWKRIDDLGFHWISIWDHFYSVEPDDLRCFEAVSIHAALACHTSRVRVGSLVYSVGYRHPAVIAKAITTIDHLSGGRAELGIGAGWLEDEYRAFGIPFPGAGERSGMLEEAAACIRGLLRDETTTFSGSHFQLEGARNEPRPVQPALPIWVGGGGEQRTLRTAARFADGWNVAFAAPDAFAQKSSVLDRRCEEVGRDPREVQRAVNVGLAWTEESLVQQFGANAEYVRAGVLGGSDQEVVDRIGEYAAAGAGQVNIAVRAPFDVEAVERLAQTLLT